MKMNKAWKVRRGLLVALLSAVLTVGAFPVGVFADDEATPPADDSSQQMERGGVFSDNDVSSPPGVASPASETGANDEDAPPAGGGEDPQAGVEETPKTETNNGAVATPAAKEKLKGKAGSVSVQSNDFEGNGTETSPYKIADKAGFLALATAVKGGTGYSGVYFKLTADITIASTDSFAGIGISLASPFKGVFDGGGHTVTATISDTSTTTTNGRGLFGYTLGTADSRAKVSNLTVKGSVSAVSYVGGIVGYADAYSVIENCVNEADVTVTGSSNNYVGGIVSYATNSIIKDCVNKGAVKANGSTTKYAGGIVGYVTASSSILDCENAGAVTHSGTSITYLGGVVGYVYNGNYTISGCENKGNVTNTAATGYVGGIVGDVAPGAVATYSGTIENCTNSAIISSSQTGNGLGGIVGYIANGTDTISGCVNTGEIRSTATSGGYSLGGVIGNNYSGTLTISDCVNDADITHGNAGSVSTYIAGILGRTGAATKISDCSNKRAISATVLANPAGIVSNASNSLTLTRCFNTGDITSVATGTMGDYVGGLVANVAISTVFSVTDSYNTGDVSSGIAPYAGGVVGRMATAGMQTVRDCYNMGTVTSGSTDANAGVGGIVGYILTAGTVKNCYNAGAVTGDSDADVGGIIGYPQGTSVSNDYIADNFYLSGTAGAGCGKSIADVDYFTAFTDKNSVFLLSGLGPVWQADLASNLNDGYPILKWQNPDATFMVDFTAADAETDVTLDSVSYSIKDKNPTEPGVFDLSKGVYEWTASRAGYGQTSDSFKVNKTGFTVPVKMTSLKYGYNLTVIPSNAALTVSNAALEKVITNPEATKDTDHNAAVYGFLLADENAYGAYEYDVRGYGYTPTSGSIRVTASGGKTVALDEAMKRDVAFTLTPTNASISLTNAEFGVKVSPASRTDGVVTYEIPDGDYSYRIKAGGYGTTNGAITVSGNASHAIDLAGKDRWDGTYDIDWYLANPNATSYEIAEPEELAGLAKLVNGAAAGVTGAKDFAGRTITLTGDLNLGGLDWEPIGWIPGTKTPPSFKGIFNGDGHTITSLSAIKMPPGGSGTFTRPGLFGTADSAEFRNLNMVDATVSSGTSNAGAVVAYATSCTFSGLSISGSVSASTGYAGGVAGQGKGSSFMYCVNNATIHSKGQHAGGIVGYTEGVSGRAVSILNCTNTGNVTGTSQVGGIVGNLYSSSGSQVIRCVNEGDISATYTANGNYYAAGGVVGCIYSSNNQVVQYCVNKGEVSGSIQNMGGIVGSSSAATASDNAVRDSYNMGNVTNAWTGSGTNYPRTGGIIGFTAATTAANMDRIQRNYNAGTVSYTGAATTKYTGGVIGYPSATEINAGVTNRNYYLENDNYMGNGRTDKDHQGAYESFESDLSGAYTDLIPDLGSAFRADGKEDDKFIYNDGFPILKWQVPGEKFTASFLVGYDDETNKGSGQPEIKVQDAEDKFIAPSDDDRVFLLQNGNYTYKVSQDGYEEAAGGVLVDYEDTTLPVTLTAIKYDFTFRAPSGGALTLKQGDNLISPSGLNDDTGVVTYDLYNGTYTYRYVKFGYDAVEGNITVNYGNGSEKIEPSMLPTRSLQFSLQPAENAFAAGDPVVYIYSRDADFEGRLIESYDGSSPLQGSGLHFPVGSYSYRIKADGFDTVKGEFDIEDEDVRIEETLAVKSGWGGAKDVDTSWYTDDPSATKFTIRTEAELAGLARLVNGTAEGVTEATDFAGKTVRLTRNMNLKGEAWTPIGLYDPPNSVEFRGVFDGDGHVVTIERGSFGETGSKKSAGLFGCIMYATISGVTMRGEVSTQGEATGGLSAYAGYSKVVNCSNQMDINASGGFQVGGLVGWSVSTSYESCSNLGSVTGLGGTQCNVGGITGFNSSSETASTMSNCYNTGELSASSNASGTTHAYAGGLIGLLGATKERFTMSNCYSAGSLSATVASGTNASEKALVGGAPGGSIGGVFNNNYYLDSIPADPKATASKTDAVMREPAFTTLLNQEAYIHNPSGYPLLAWDRPVDHLAVTTPPTKTIYEDLEDFDATGMVVTAYMTSDESQPVIIDSGWAVKDGKSLKASQTSVTVEYKGVTTTCAITVKQIVHSVADSELGISLTPPKTGETPQSSISLTAGQQKKISSAVIRWTRHGKAFSGAFEAATYYRAEVTLTAIYTTGDVYYAFGKYARPDVSGAYEVLNARTEPNSDGVPTTLKFTATFRATSYGAQEISDRATHLYYKGNHGGRVNYDAMLSRTLTVSGGALDAPETLSVEQVEALLLSEDIGYGRDYGDEKYAGVRLYPLLLKHGLDRNAADGVKIRVIGRSSLYTAEFTVGQLRKTGVSDPFILAYGDTDADMPLASAKGPLCLIQGDKGAAGGVRIENVSSIEILSDDRAATYALKITASESNPTVSVSDAYGNPVAERAPGVYAVRDGERYDYAVTKTNLTVERGNVGIGGSDVSVHATLKPVWDGKTYTQPKQDDKGYSLIGTGAELMWWAVNGQRADKVRLTADIALNNGVDFVNKWPIPFGRRSEEAFAGEFDGNGHIVTGFYIDRENTYELKLTWDGSVLASADRISQVGFIGYARENAVIKDLGVEGRIHLFDRPDGIWADYIQIGGIVGFAEGDTQISGCYANIGLLHEASTESGEVGGYPLAGYGYMVDAFVGGIAGSLSGRAKVTDCYSMGELIGMNTRTVNVGGVVGGLRTANVSVERSWSSAKLRGLNLESSKKMSYMGGIAGHITLSVTDNGDGSVRDSVALNREIRGNSPDGINAGRVSGNGDSTLSGNSGLSGMPLTGVGRPTNEGSANGVNGADAGAAATAGSALYTGKGWSSDVWKTGDGYPSLAWQTAKAGPEESVLIDDGASGNGGDENAWDGYFSELTPPPYFKVKYRVGDHAAREAVTYTRADMQKMAAADNNGTRYYSAGLGAGRVVKEYVNLETIITQAGLTFASGDWLEYNDYDDYGNSIKYRYSYTGLMASRYYYPEWSSGGSAAGAQKVAPVIALKSFGASNGVNKNSWDYYAAQADYLYAYMLTFGQTTPDEVTYRYFRHQQTETTVVYPTESAINNTLTAAVQKAISDAKADRTGTVVSDDRTDAKTSQFYVNEAVANVFDAAIGVAESALTRLLTNGEAMDVITALEKARKIFDNAKKPGQTADEVSLAGLVDLVKELLDRVVLANRGSAVTETEVWATHESVEAMKNALSDAEAVLNSGDVFPQTVVDGALRDLRASLGDFAAYSGESELLARALAVEKLATFLSGLDRSDYRNEELARIDAIADAARLDFGVSTTIDGISEILVKARQDIAAVRTRIEVLRDKAGDELTGSINLNAYKSGERYQIIGILSAAKQALSAAQTEADIERIKSDIREQIALVRTAVQIDREEEDSGSLVEGEDTALRAAIVAAINELGVHYGHSSFYFKKEYTQLTAVIDKYTKQVIVAKSIGVVNSAMAAARAEIAKIKTIAQVNKGKRAAFKELKTELRLAKAGKRSIAATWKTVSGAKGYQLLLARDTGFTTGRKVVTIKKSTAMKTTVKKLASKKTYYVKVRAYTVVDDRKAYTDWSEPRKVRIK